MITLSMPGPAGGSVVVLPSAPTIDDKALTPAVTAGDDSDTTITISHTPANDSYVAVLVNGVQVELGDAVQTKDCYFTDDAGATAQPIGDIAIGDALFWNGVIAGYELDATDEIDLNYNTLVP